MSKCTTNPTDGPTTPDDSASGIGPATAPNPTPGDEAAPAQPASAGESGAPPKTSAGSTSAAPKSATGAKRGGPKRKADATAGDPAKPAAKASRKGSKAANGGAGKPAARAGKGPQKPAASAKASSKRAAAAPGDGKQPKLRPGELDGLVLKFMKDNASSGPHSPTSVSRGLQRSSGAVANCLARLKTTKQVRQVGDKPRRYKIAA